MRRCSASRFPVAVALATLLAAGAVLAGMRALPGLDGLQRRPRGPQVLGPGSDQPGQRAAAWRWPGRYRTGDIAARARRTARACPPLQANPIVVGDTLYGLGQNNKVFALDAATGKPRWVHRSTEQGVPTRRGPGLLGEPRPQGPAGAVHRGAPPDRAGRGHGHAGALVRQGRGGHPVRRPRFALPGRGAVARHRVRGSADHGVGGGRGVPDAAREHPGLRRPHRGAALGVPHRAPPRASSATRPGRPTRGSTTAGPTSGARSAWT